MLCALIMAGGKGTRFWPLSTEERPKQFLNLIGEETMIQMTVSRIRAIIPIERIFICTGKRYVDLVKEQIPELDERNIIVEPEGRNTTPCIALSAMFIQRYYKDATMVVLPSDHLIKDEESFRNTLLIADRFIKNNKEAIVTLGMNPTRAEVGYGYIKYGNKVELNDGYGILKVDAFVEKPDEKTAEKYLRDGSYLWNGGMFIWSIDNIISKIREYSRVTFDALESIKKVSEKELQSTINKSYMHTEAISIDYSVLEKSNDIYVIPSDFGWDDIGTWKSVERYKQKDDDNNIITNNVKVIDSKFNMAINGDKKIVMIGVNHIMTLETNDTIFIVNKDYMENLRDYQESI